MAIKQLEQTNRTIMFSKINSERPSLTKILSKADEDSITISDDLLKEIENELVVGSFDEFLKKFNPTIYSKSVNGEIIYSLRKDGSGNWSECPINMSNDFLNLIISIIDGKTGTTNIEFEYQEEFKRLLGVDAATKKIERAIDEIKYLRDCFDKAEAGSPEQKDLMKKGQKAYQRIVTDFNNPITLLPWFQGMIKGALIDKGAAPGFAPKVEAATQKLIGTSIQLDSNGIPILVEDEPNDNNQIEQISEKNETADTVTGDNEFGKALVTVYDAGVKKNIVVADKTGKQMLVSLFGEADSVKKIKEKCAELSVPELTERYNQFSKQIDTQYANFAKVAKLLIEEIVGIRMFFEQSRISKNKMPVKLLVTNDDLEDFSGKENVLEQFLIRVNTTESDYSKSIWYAIISNMSMAEEDEEPDWLDEDDEKEDRDSNSISVVTKMVKILGKYGIQSFVGFENNKDNTFSDVQQKGVSKYKNATEKFVLDEEVNKYFIPCLPNFTVVPESKSRLKSQGEYGYQAAEAVNDDEEVSFIDKGYLDLGGFYVNAGYIAAGIVAACQSPDYLLSKKIKIITDAGVSIPGVRFDLERHFDKIDVKMGIEVGGYTEKVKDEINEEQYGFVFASEGGAKTHIMKARNLKKTENGDYEPLFVTSTYTYIERLYKYNYTNNITKETADAFFGSTNRSVFWDKYLKFENALLQKNDVLTYSVDGTNVNLELKLNGVERQLNFKINH